MDRDAKQTRSQITQFRAEQTGDDKFLEGYFSVFGGTYELWPGATESIDPHAFDDALGDDIRALIDHDTAKVLGRNKSGTLELRVDSRGLWGPHQSEPERHGRNEPILPCGAWRH